MACNPNSTVCLHIFNVFFVLQANDEYIMFEGDNVNISVVNLEMKTIPMAKGKRQTLLIPSNTAEEWLLVS